MNGLYAVISIFILLLILSYFVYKHETNRNMFVDLWKDICNMPDFETVLKDIIK